MMIAPIRLERRSFPIPYQYANSGIQPGEAQIIWYMDVPTDWTGFLRKVAADVYNDCYIEWKIDGKLIEKVERSILEVESFTPETFDPPYIIKRWMKFIYHNEGDNCVYPGVMCNGELVRRVYSDNPVLL